MLDAHTATANAPKPVLLAEYQPPPFVVDRVDLCFELHETATRVVSRLELRRNPAADGAESLSLDGEALTLLRIALDGRTLTESEYRLNGGSLIIDALPAAATLEIETRIDPAGTPNSAGSIYRTAAISRSAKRRGSAASPTSRTGLMSCHATP